MGPTSRGSVTREEGGGQGVGEVADAEAPDAPPWSNRCQRLQDEAALASSSCGRRTRKASASK